MKFILIESLHVLSESQETRDGRLGPSPSKRKSKRSDPGNFELMLRLILQPSLDNLNSASRLFLIIACFVNHRRPYLFKLLGAIPVHSNRDFDPRDSRLFILYI